MDLILQRILYVEDEVDIQMIAQIALEDIGGFQLKLCSSGYEALAVAEDFKPHLLLLDVMMPGMDGTATLKALRQLPSIKEVPAIFLTARIQSEEIEAYRKLGIIDTIVKPFDPLTLADVIRHHWSSYIADKQ